MQGKLRKVTTTRCLWRRHWKLTGIGCITYKLQLNSIPNRYCNCVLLPNFSNTASSIPTYTSIANSSTHHRHQLSVWLPQVCLTRLSLTSMVNSSDLTYKLTFDLDIQFIDISRRSHVRRHKSKIWKSLKLEIFCVLFLKVLHLNNCTEQSLSIP